VLAEKERELEQMRAYVGARDGFENAGKRQRNGVAQPTSAVNDVAKRAGIVGNGATPAPFDISALFGGGGRAPAAAAPLLSSATQEAAAASTSADAAAQREAMQRAVADAKRGVAGLPDWVKFTQSPETMLQGSENRNWPKTVEVRQSAAGQAAPFLRIEQTTLGRDCLNANPNLVALLFSNPDACDNAARTLEHRNFWAKRATSSQSSAAAAPMMM